MKAIDGKLVASILLRRIVVEKNGAWSKYIQQRAKRIQNPSQKLPKY
jgi:hypothetical protein